MSNRFVLILAACVVGFIGLLIVNKQEADAPATQEVTATSYYLGPEDAPVTLTEYGDFQCPACAAYYPIVQEVKAAYPDQVRFQFRHFPLVQIHPNAMAAHRAAEAAGQQGKFFEMHDLLYERQSNWTQSSNPGEVFATYAEEIGLNMEQYNQTVGTSEINAIIQADSRAAQDVGVASTPTFLINGEKIEDNPRDLEGFKQLIEEVLQSETSN